MRARILRGAHEIGGGWVEVATEGSRIILDVGKPLWVDWDEIVPFPPVAGLSDGSDSSLAGVVISHPHLDHYGLADQVDTNVLLFIGQKAAAILKAAAFFSSAGVDLHPAGYLSDRFPFYLGAFTITPFLMITALSTHTPCSSRQRGVGSSIRATSPRPTRSHVRLRSSMPTSASSRPALSPLNQLARNGIEANNSSVSCSCLRLSSIHTA